MKGTSLAVLVTRLAVIGTAALVAAGCAGPGATAPPSTTVPVTVEPPGRTPSPATRAPSPSLEVPPLPSEVPGPPTAVLIAADGERGPGAAGTFTWNGVTSDAPWVVPSPARAVAGQAPFRVQLEPTAVTVTHWVARWAPIRSGQAGDATLAASGDAGPIMVPGPGPVAAGPWSLQVLIRSGPGREVLFYWRVDVLP